VCGRGRSCQAVAILIQPPGHPLPPSPWSGGSWGFNPWLRNRRRRPERYQSSAIPVRKPESTRSSLSGSCDSPRRLSDSGRRRENCGHAVSNIHHHCRAERPWLGDRLIQSIPKVLSIWPTTRCGTGLSPCWPNLRSPERLAHRARSPPFGRCPLRLRQSDERRHSS
jgi:hypothetical protein